VLSRRKSSIAVSIKDPRGVALIKELVKHVDVIIDPFRPGVLETGFRRDGKYAQMAGHDINYIAVSGVLSMLGMWARF